MSIDTSGQAPLGKIVSDVIAEGQALGPVQGRPAVRREDSGDHGSLSEGAVTLLRAAANDARAATLAIEKALADGKIDQLPNAMAHLRDALARCGLAR